MYFGWKSWIISQIAAGMTVQIPQYNICFNILFGCYFTQMCMTMENNIPIILDIAWQTYWFEKKEILWFNYSCINIVFDERFSFRNCKKNIGMVVIIFFHEKKKEKFAKHVEAVRKVVIQNYNTDNQDYPWLHGIVCKQ